MKNKYKILLSFIIIIIASFAIYTVKAVENKTLLCLDYPKVQTYKTSMYVEGWGMSEEKEVQIKAYIDTTEVTEQLKRMKRIDVLSSIKGYGDAITNPTPGFQGIIDLSLFKDGQHTFVIKAISNETQQVLAQETKTFTINKYNSLICVDYPRANENVKDNLYVEGWLMSENAEAQVKLYIDEKDYSDAIVRTNRNDVLSAIKGYGGSTSNPQPGYKANIDLKHLKDGQHSVKIQIYSPKSEEIMFEHTREIQVKKYNSLLCVDYPITNGKEKDSLYVEGWVMSEDKDAQVKLYIDGEDYSSEIQRTQREDVINAVKEYGGSSKNSNPGYQANVDLTNVKDGIHQVTIKVYSPNSEEIMCEHTRNIQVNKYDTLMCLDYPKNGENTNYNLYIEGWIMSEDKNATIYAYIDGIDYSNYIERTERKDVINAIKGYGGINKNTAPGFTANIDLGKFKDGIHTLIIKAISPNTEDLLFQEIRKITVKKYTGTMNIEAPSQKTVTSGDLYIEGWEMSECKNTNIKVYIDNKAVPASFTRKEREDVLNAVKEYGGVERNETPGFYATVNVTKFNDGNHTLKVEVYSDLGEYITQFQKAIIIYNNQYWGIDVSHFQGTIDFDALMSTKELDFMIVQAGYGQYSNQKDTQFERNYAEAKKRNIPIGAYLYSYALDVEGAKREAYNMLGWLEGKSFELPIFYDIEDKSQQSIPKETKTDMCLAFGEILKSAGYKVGIYTSKNWLASEIDISKIPNDYDIWVASYGEDDGEIPSDIYKYIGKHEIWQYTSTGTVNGITGNVDFNICYKKYF